MENASYALLMAGGILITLLVISVVVFMFIQLGSAQHGQDEITKASQIAEFNEQFEPYNRDKLTLFDLKSIWNKIDSNNRKYAPDKENMPEYIIDTNINNLFNGPRNTNRYIHSYKLVWF